MQDLSKCQAAAYVLGFDTAQRLEIGALFNKDDAQKYLGYEATENEIGSFLAGANDCINTEILNGKYRGCVQMLD